MQSLARWFPFLNWPKPTTALLRGEFWAGLTVGLMLLPQGVAYAALAGMPYSRAWDAYLDRDTWAEAERRPLAHMP